MKTAIKYNRTAWAIGVAMVLFMSAAASYAGGNIDRDSNHANVGALSAKWIQWAYAGPDGANSIQDQTGELCALNQPKKDIWFLAGSFNKTGVVRNCTIPANRALFYPLIEGEWIDCPGTTDVDVPDVDARKTISSYFDYPTLLTSTLDGVPISALQIPTVRVQSPKFTSVLPLGNIKGGCLDSSKEPAFVLPAGKTGRQFADGYWVMLPPLTPGLHILNLHGASSVNSFENEVTYNLTVLGDDHDKR